MNNLITQLALINRGSRSVMAWSHVGLVGACSLLFCLFLLGLASAHFIQSEVLGILPAQEVRVTLKMKDVSLFRLPEPGSQTRITTKDLKSMAQMAGVARVFPLSYADQPASVEANILGRSYAFDMVVQGLDPAWVQDTIATEALHWREGDAIPVVLNTQLLAIYNSGYARSRGLPQLTATALTTPSLVLHYGADTGAISLPARIVGLSPKVALGMAIPLETLTALHRRLGIDPPVITEVVLALEAQADPHLVRAGVENLGFAVEAPHPLSETIRQLRAMGGLAGLILAGCAGLLAFAYLNQTLKMLFLVKKKDYAVCRAMGMSRTKLRALLLIDLAFTITLDLGFGLFLGYFTAMGIHHFFLESWLQHWFGTSLTLHLPWRWTLYATLFTLASGFLFLFPRILVLTRQPVGMVLRSRNL